jgi:predicted nucleic acid-binding protein
MDKVEIVLDADVIIHFAKADCLSLLPTIFPEYRMVVLSVVNNELKGVVKQQLENMTNLLKIIHIIPFNPSKEMKLEYARLNRTFGKGESACMAYCRYTNNVIGSSNLKDIKEYCQQHKLVYLTTVDFLYYAIKRNKMSINAANQFIHTVIEKGSKLPIVDFNTFLSQVAL